jgi:hypothetical protein
MHGDALGLEIHIMALGISGSCESYGFDPLLFVLNGFGGYNLVWLSEPASVAGGDRV